MQACETAKFRPCQVRLAEDLGKQRGIFDVLACYAANLHAAASVLFPSSRYPHPDAFVARCAAPHTGHGMTLALYGFATNFGNEVPVLVFELNSMIDNLIPFLTVGALRDYSSTAYANTAGRSAASVFQSPREP